jgi:hypothetical protein
MSEHDEQAALFQWAAWIEPRLPVLKLLHAIPNGGYRAKRTAALLKQEGVKPGVPDVCLPVARGAYHGLYVELKSGRNTISDYQEQWIEALRTQGYFVDICWGWQQAARVIADYLGVSPAECGL